NKVRTDRLGNLYLLTVTNGFRKVFIRNYPVKYFGSGVTGNRFAVSVLPDKPANRILVGTQGNGLLVYDTIGQLVQHFQFETKNNATNSPSNIIRLEDGSYLVFIWGQNFVWHLSKDLQSKRVHSVLPANDSILNEYYTNSFQDYAKRSWVVSNKSSLVISPNGKSIRISPFKKLDFAASAIIGRQLLNVEDETLVFRNEATLSIERKIQLKNTGGVRCIYVDKRRNIFAGTNKGVFWLDESGTLKGHYSKKNGLPDECIYGVVTDASGNIWASTNRGLMAILSDGSVLPLSKIHGLQENEFNTNVAAVADDGEIFFGGVNGVTGFYPERVLAYNDTVQLLLTNVLINGTPLGRDTSYWSMKSIELPYNENTIQLDFLAMGFYGPDNYNYQYRILERGNDWINIGTNRNAQFFLPPGRYRLQLFASSFFKADAEPLKELEIVIRNPFWKSGWFRTLIAILLIGLVVVAFYLKFKRRYQAQQLQLKMEEQKRIERERISRDLHDSLGAYVNVVLYHIELLEDGKNLTEVGPVLTNLKFASKDMINVLRDTVWALKKDSFTAQDCVIRIREFLHSCSKYYSSINFSFEGNVPEEKVLVYNKALNLLRIVEEGVTNSIKHSGCRNIVLRSLEDGMNWKIEIEDDGKGFDAHSEYDGNGLHNIKSRALESGFKINFDSKALSGTKISITL
ncbi:MAG: histidine kinase, partial [Chitinophagaceae bacterium]|nr:histidine kinase [Chitinophagaceae bacterium]